MWSYMIAHALVIKPSLRVKFWRCRLLIWVCGMRFHRNWCNSLIRGWRKISSSYWCHQSMISRPYIFHTTAAYVLFSILTLSPRPLTQLWCPLRWHQFDFLLWQAFCLWESLLQSIWFHKKLLSRRSLIDSMRPNALLLVNCIMTFWELRAGSCKSCNELAKSAIDETWLIQWWRDFHYFKILWSWWTATTSEASKELKMKILNLRQLMS